VSALPAGDWTVDGPHSVVAFEVEHNSLQEFRARFTEYSAELKTDDGGLGIEGSVAVESVDIGLDKLREVVLSDEFLDAANHPEITFRSSDINLSDDGSLEVKGTLGLKGNSGEVTARGKLTGPVTDLHGSPRVSVQVEAVINRKEYGLEWHADLDGGEAVLGDDVKLIANLELAQG
jgi:polyisoprenoid-binding protein YceI